MQALWTEIRPKHLEDLTVQPLANQLISSICETFDFPHLMFCGPPGSGKKTRIMAFLRQLFHADIDKMHTEYRNIEVNDKDIEVQVTYSPYHVEITPADAGNNDRHVISFFLKELASSECVGNVPIKIVVINEAHRLSKLAQQALRRTMEKYARTCRIILVADSLSQIAEPIRSRCLIIRTPRVSTEDVRNVVCNVADGQNFKVSDSLIDQIVEEAHGDMRRGIMLLQMMHLQRRGSKSDSIVVPEWETYTDNLTKILVSEQLSAETMGKIRNHLYELLTHCVPPTEIFKRLLHNILLQVDSQLIDPICQAASQYEARMQNGTKPIYHLEAFIARFICIYRDYLEDITASD